jgi:hypothetical protein
MNALQLPLPSLLVELIGSGAWTRPDGSLADGRDLGKKAARVLSPYDDELILLTPPFHTIADEVEWGNQWWIEGLNNVGEIDYEKALIIADFGAGSDSPIILYYGAGGEPVVMYLKWTRDDQGLTHAWEETHPSFREFAMAVGLVV